MSVILEINPEYSNEHLQALARAEIAEFHKPKTFDERQAKMRMMLARMKEPEYQTDVAAADAVIKRVAEAHRKNIKWENADDQGRPEAMIIKERRVAETRQEKAEADDERSRLRGDSLDDAQAPTTAPATPAAVELDADAPVPMADAPAKTPAPLPALTTSQIAGCFAGFHGWDAGKWIDNLQSPSPWLLDCRHQAGRQGKPIVESTWWPVQIAVALDKKHANIKGKLHARFKNQEPLKPWYESLETNLPSDIETLENKR